MLADRHTNKLADTQTIWQQTQRQVGRHANKLAADTQTSWQQTHREVGNGHTDTAGSS